MLIPVHKIYILKYAIAAALAVFFDVLIYAVLVTYSFLEPGFSNAVSTPLGCVLGWFISGKTLFRSNGIRLSGYAIWIAYQIFVIALYSILVQWLVFYHFDKYLAKAMIIAISFSVNSVFFKFIILRRCSKSH